LYSYYHGVYVDVLLTMSKLYMKATSDKFEHAIMPSFNVRDVNIQLLGPLVRVCVFNEADAFTPP